MIGEREDLNTETNYGSLVMRAYSIDGNEINAFYDSSNNLIFVLDNTLNSYKTNVLLVINPDGDKKWDEILSGDYGVDLETIRPKQDNKYQKLDIEYSGVSVYDDLIKAYNAGDALEEPLQRLAVLRDSAVRHSAMMRLNAANEIIAKTNTTIVKTKESIVRLQARLKTLRSKLTEAKKGIGRVPTKQSAAKILKLESQIEATNEKLKRAQDRLKSAQRRLETATVDAELASDLLNQSAEENEHSSKKNDSLIVAPKHRVAKVDKKTSLPQIVEPDLDDEPEEEKEAQDMAYDDEIVDENDTETTDEEETTEETTEETVEEETVEEEPKSDVEPLIDQDPKILNDDIAFKPISFEAPTDSYEDVKEDDEGIVPVLDRDMITTEETTEEKTEETVEEEPTEKIEEEIKEETVEKPVLESMTSIKDTPEYKMAVPENDFDIEEPAPAPVVEEPKLVAPEPVVPEARQQEPVYSQPSAGFGEERRDVMPEPTMPMRPVSPAAPVVPPFAPQSANNFQTNNMQPRKSRHTVVYYFLLILLIVLAVLTLWLYQRSVENGSPELTPVVEQQNRPNKNFLKQKQKVEKPVVDEEDSGPVFVDEKSEANNKVVEEKPETFEEEEVVNKEPSAPQVMGDVPARVNTSGQENEVEKKTKTEDDVLAKKPVFEPGAKHDEMFVAEEDEYVEQEPEVVVTETTEYVEYESAPEYEQELVYEPEPVQETEVVDDEYYGEENPFYDEEEEQYQLEQAEMYYEE